MKTISISKSFPTIYKHINKIQQLPQFSLIGIITTVFGFIFSWTPYAVTFFITAFNRTGYVTPPMAIFLCSCFAKTSVLWIPLLYYATSKQFRLSLVDVRTLGKLDETTKSS